MSMKNNLSAGRVQSVAVRLIAEREREINAFTAVSAFKIEASFTAKDLSDKNVTFGAEGKKYSGAGDAEDFLKSCIGAKYTVADIQVKPGKKSPAAPFTTSTLQQEASRKLGYSVSRTMLLAQKLYESGKITYMRTDSVNLSETAMDDIKNQIVSQYGNKYYQSRKYKNKNESAQEAHEAIRPTLVAREPKSLTEYLTKDQLKLYTLIWQRFVASQMAAAIFDTVSVDIDAQGATIKYLFRVAGSTLRFAGFLAVYEEARDEDGVPDDEADAKTLPTLTVNDVLALIRLLPEQHFTQPPPRYTEASLVKTLEEYGIGRPSTYAPIISTIQQRGYVTREDKRLTPTETGTIVNDLLVGHFPEIVGVDFTANMEEELDEIAEGRREWVPVLREFWEPFAVKVKAAEAEMPQVSTEPEPVGRDCPQSGHPLIIRWGRYGKFIGCSNFPDCRYTEPWLEKIGVRCPKDGGEIAERKTRKGRVFYGCSNYPACDFTSWKRPLPQPCPHCGGLLVVANKNRAQCTVCSEPTELSALQPVA
jgi:DNA topoisomerase-1